MGIHLVLSLCYSACLDEREQLRRPGGTVCSATRILHLENWGINPYRLDAVLDRNFVDCLSIRSERINGGHHIFTNQAVEKILNLQPRGSQAKPYQVKQVRNVIVGYGLAGETL